MEMLFLFQSEPHVPVFLVALLTDVLCVNLFLCWGFKFTHCDLTEAWRRWGRRHVPLVSCQITGAAFSSCDEEEEAYLPPPPRLRLIHTSTASCCCSGCCVGSRASSRQDDLNAHWRQAQHCGDKICVGDTVHSEISTESMDHVTLRRIPLMER